MFLALLRKGSRILFSGEENSLSDVSACAEPFEDRVDLLDFAPALNLHIVFLSHPIQWKVVNRLKRDSFLLKVAL